MSLTVKPGETSLPISRAAYNRMVSLMHDDSFIELIKELRSEIHGKDTRISFKRLSDIRKELAGFLQKKGYSINWVQPIYNMVREKEFQLDFPLEDGLSISIGGEEITANNPTSLMFMAHKLELTSTRKISIQISSQVSESTLVRFIKQIKPLLKMSYDFLNLPEEYKDKRSQTDLAMAVNELKEAGYSYEEIADDFCEKHIDLVDSAKIKTLYNRYKDLFS